jgi:hypothetical protein
VEVNVGHDGHVHLFDNMLQRRCGVFVRTGHSDDIGTGFFSQPNLFNGSGHIRGQGVCHGLHGNWGIAPHGDFTHMDLPGFASHNVAVGPHAHGSARLFVSGRVPYSAFFLNAGKKLTIGQ